MGSAVTRGEWILRVALGPLPLAGAAAWTALWISVALGLQLCTGDRRRSLAMARRIWAPGLLRLLGVRVESLGIGALPEGGSFVVVANHQSMLDIPILFSVLPINLRFTAKRSLARVPFLGRYMRSTGMVFLDRARSEEARKRMRDAAACLRDGASVVVFPEGTYGDDLGLRRFKSGAFRLAVAARRPVLPVAIEGSGRCFGREAWSVRPGVVRVRIGVPIAPHAGERADKGSREAHRVLAERAHARIERALDRSRRGPERFPSVLGVPPALLGEQSPPAPVASDRPEDR